MKSSVTAFVEHLTVTHLSNALLLVAHGSEDLHGGEDGLRVRSGFANALKRAKRLCRTCKVHSQKTSLLFVVGKWRRFPRARVTHLIPVYPLSGSTVKERFRSPVQDKSSCLGRYGSHTYSHGSLLPQHPRGSKQLVGPGRKMLHNRSLVANPESA